ncbi:MAG: glycosyltransferase family 39 protein, partial [Planctomycetaceae bacterium]
MASDNGESPAPVIGPTGGRWWLACGIVLALVLAATVPTTGDIGLTWDEPAYRYSQVMSAQWWERLAQARTRSDLRALFEPDALLYYWPYGRHGINFHPPLAGQLNLATYAIFGRWIKDIPARRLASVFEHALTITIGFGFLARRYGPWVGGVMAGALLFMPRVYGDGHIAGTDAPGLLLWAATALAFWKGLHEPQARHWRVAVGVLVGLAFVEKMAAVLVFLPLLLWLAASRLPRTLVRPGGRADWSDGALTSAAMLAPLGGALAEILRLGRMLPPPGSTDLFIVRPAGALPGAILAVPLLVWIVRRLLGRVLRNHPVWGVERPALEIATAVLAFAPVVGWLGNPAWWREALPRLAHYARLGTARRGALPDIQILYFGQTYEYSLPWHNAWVLIAITVPASILAAAVAGVLVAVLRVGRDRLPLFFLVNLVTLPVTRMLPTPAHDGVRLFLPTFFFLAGLAGWGAVGLADGLARLLRARAVMFRGAAAALVLVPAAWQLIKIHPFELSYYNELVGGPRGAWDAGFELAYWYDAFNDRTLAALNQELPPGATVDTLNPLSNPPTFFELQALGELRGDIILGARSPDEFP